MNPARYWICGGDEGAKEGELQQELCLTAAGVGASGKARAARETNERRQLQCSGFMFADRRQKQCGGNWWSNQRKKTCIE